jgi:hypothetical protein
MNFKIEAYYDRQWCTWCALAKDEEDNILATEYAHTKEQALYNLGMRHNEIMAMSKAKMKTIVWD